MHGFRRSKKIYNFRNLPGISKKIFSFTLQEKITSFKSTLKISSALSSRKISTRTLIINYTGNNCPGNNCTGKTKAKNNDFFVIFPIKFMNHHKIKHLWGKNHQKLRNVCISMILLLFVVLFDSVGIHLHGIWIEKHPAVFPHLYSPHFEHSV